MEEFKIWVPEPIPPGWQVLDDNLRAQILSELHIEIAAAHPLFGLTLSPVAKCVGCDETLIFVDNSRWALVHITWRRQLERPPWPHTEVFEAAMPMEAMRLHADHAAS